MATRRTIEYWARAKYLSKTTKEWLAKSSISKQKEHSVLIDLIFSLIGLSTGIASAIIANSTTMYSEVLKNAGLTIAIFLSWFSLRKVRLGKTEIYNYGYGKLENFSSLIVTAVMIISFILILSYTVGRFMNPVAMRTIGVDIALGFSVFALICSLVQWKNDHRLAKKEQSPVMDSLWRLHRLKTISTGMVALSLLLSLVFKGYEWSLYIDPIGSSIIALFLAYSIYSVGTQSMYDLLDHALEESLQFIILNALASYFDEYEFLHGIRSRRSGGNVYIEIFLEFDGERKMSDVQKVIDSIKANVEQRIQDSYVVVATTRSAVT